MKTEKYLQFGIAGAVMNNSTVINRTDQTLVIDTTDFKDPLPDGTDVISAGVIKVEVAAVTAGMTLGSAYPAEADIIGQRLELNSGALAYNDNGTITITAVSSDAVNGFTISGTQADNDYIVTQLLPYATADFVTFAASRFTGASVKTSNSTYLYFEPLTGDGVGNNDAIVVTHGADKFLDVCKLMNDLVADETPQSGPIVVADVMKGIFVAGNPAGITGVAFTLDS